MTEEEYAREYDVREEGRSMFEWPLAKEGAHMGAGELLDELIEAIQRLNRTPEWPLTLLVPDFGDVIVDRRTRTIHALCMWKRKPQKEED